MSKVCFVVRSRRVCISCKFHAEGYAKKSLVRQENNSRSIEFNEITVITIK